VLEHVLVTGGAGFIGSNLVDHINKFSPNTRVTVFDDLSSGLEENLVDSRCVFRKESILDYEALVEASVQVDAIVHLAAIGSVPRSIANPRPTHDANTTGTLNVLEAARENKVNYVVVASSSSVYGANPSLPKTEWDWTRPLSPYAASKLFTEASTLAYGFSYGMKTLALRFFNVYGPRQRADHDYAAVIPRFIDAAMAGRPIQINGDGLQSRDFTFVDSVCETLWEACLRQVSHPHPVNLAFGTNTTLLELLGVISPHFNQPLKVNHEPPRVGDVRASQADPTLLSQLFPDLEPIKIEKGVSRTIEWFAASRVQQG